MTFVRPRTVQSEFLDFGSSADYAGGFDASPGERIGAPFERRGPLARLSLLCAALSGAYFLFAHPELRQTLADLARTLFATAEPEKIAPGPIETQAKQAAAETPPQPPPIAEANRDIKDAPGADTGTAVSAQPAAAALPPGDPAPTENNAPEPPLAPPAFDPADPLKKRAVAAGLHPDLSPALLKKLSSTDFRNASLAIEKALKETAAGDVLSWPQHGNAKLALFEVHFVRGAANCRRYVVVITKDRWSTTALPMEKCGIKAPAARKAASREVVKS